MAEPVPGTAGATAPTKPVPDVLWDRTVPPLTPDHLARYFAFVGVEQPAECSLVALAALQNAHLHAIPFENLDALLDRPIALEPDAIVTKLLGGDRGGYCFEHNLLFAGVLRALGYELDLLGGRVLVGAVAPRPRTHLALRVVVDGDEILCDVGFGRTALRGPLVLRTELEQRLGGDRFRLVDVDGELLLELAVRDGSWEPLYLLDPRPEYVVDCVMGNHYVATHPESTMKQRLMVLQPTATGKRSIGGTRFVIDEAERQVDREITLGDVAAILRDEFGIALPAPLPFLDS